MLGTPALDPINLKTYRIAAYVPQALELEQRLKYLFSITDAGGRPPAAVPKRRATIATHNFGCVAGQFANASADYNATRKECFGQLVSKRNETFHRFNNLFVPLVGSGKHTDFAHAIRGRHCRALTRARTLRAMTVGVIEAVRGGAFSRTVHHDELAEMFGPPKAFAASNALLTSVHPVEANETKYVVNRKSERLS